MSTSQFIDVGIGLVFVYLLMAIAVSAANEIFMSLKAKRGRFLRDCIALAINDPQNKSWAKLLYDHPLIDNLKRSEKRPPAYISSQTFAKALIEVISNEAKVDSYTVKGDVIVYNDKAPARTPFQKFNEGLEKLNESHTKNLLRSFVNNSNNNFDQLKSQIENWFNEYMDRVGGWYKRKARTYIFGLACLLTLIMNVDTIHLSKELWKNGVLRESVANTAEAYVAEHKATYEQEKNTQSTADSLALINLYGDSTLTKAQLALKVDSLIKKGQKEETITQKINKIKGAYNELNMLKLPIGWSDYAQTVKTYKQTLCECKKEINNDKTLSAFAKWRYRWYARCKYVYKVACLYVREITLLRIIGWLFTAIAVSLGAPYWFDLLSKLINVRATGKAVSKPADITVQEKPVTN